MILHHRTICSAAQHSVANAVRRDSWQERCHGCSSSPLSRVVRALVAMGEFECGPDSRAKGERRLARSCSRRRVSTPNRPHAPCLSRRERLHPALRTAVCLQRPFRPRSSPSSILSTLNQATSPPSLFDLYASSIPRSRRNRLRPTPRAFATSTNMFQLPPWAQQRPQQHTC